jgi:hypothetical protein
VKQWPVELSPKGAAEAAKVFKELATSITTLSDEDVGLQAEIAASPAKLIAFAQNRRKPPTDDRRG